MANAKSATGYQPTTLSPTNLKFVHFKQQHLRLLLHAHCCRQDQVPSACCTIPNCGKVRSLLKHMEECGREVDCERAYCTTSKDLIAHWRNCTDEKCVVCAPVIFIPSRRRGQPDPIVTSQSSEVGGLATGLANATQRFDAPWSQSCTMFAHLPESIESHSQPINGDVFASCPPQCRSAKLEEADWQAAFDEEFRGCIVRSM